MDDRKLMELLAKHQPLVEPSPDLALRIIVAARLSQPVEIMSFWQTLVFYLMPRPGVVVACLLLLGFVMGFAMPPLLDPPSMVAELEGDIWGDEGDLL